jgi:hypothetical protein
LHVSGSCDDGATVRVATDGSGRFLATEVPAGLYLACAGAEIGGRRYAGRRGLGVDAGITSVADLTLQAEAAPLRDPAGGVEGTVALGARVDVPITIVGDGTGASLDVIIADTLPLLDDPAGPPDPGDRDGGQAFRYVTDRPTFDPDAIRYAIDLANDAGGTAVDVCFVAPAPDLPPVFDAPHAAALCGDGTTGFASVAEARAAAEAASAAGDQIVMVEYFDAEILSRTPPEGDLEAEDSFVVSLEAVHSVNEFRLPGGALPARAEENGEWCNIVTATSAANDFVMRERCTRVVEPLLEVRKTALDARVPGGAQTRFRIELANLGSADLPGVTVVDTLDAAFQSPPTGDPGLVRVESLCAGCSVTFSADSSIVAFAVPVVSSTDANGNGVFDNGEGLTVGDLVVRAPLATGPFCNRVTAESTDGQRDTDLACVVGDLSVELDLANDDGILAGGAFADVEAFVVGDTVAYRTRITNRSSAAATGVRVRWELAPETGSLQLLGVLAGDPPGAACDAGSDVCLQEVGSLEPGASIVLDYLTLAAFTGSDVNRVTVSTDQLAVPIVNEEPTTVGP